MLAEVLPVPDFPDSLSTAFHLTGRSATVKSIVCVVFSEQTSCVPLLHVAQRMRGWKVTKQQGYQESLSASEIQHF